ncbi:MAG: cytochrome c [Gammaproteobacteria bacterium]|nr:cytochrome c [Gammaproteobacteria bacterium]
MKQSVSLIMIGAALMLCGSLARAADASTLLSTGAKRGEALYQANCTRCHDTSVHTRPNSIIHSLDALKKRVRFCETNARLKWSDEQVEDVTVWLNETFYKFK